MAFLRWTTLLSVVTALTLHPASGYEPIRHNNPGLRVDLGVGLWAWPLPMDYDEDGDLDLIVTCPDVPQNGTFFFENTEGNVKFPVFKPARRIGKSVRNVQISHVAGKPRILAPNQEFSDFRKKGFEAPLSLGLKANLTGGRLRANQWKYVDYDADGTLDLMVGTGDWQEYGWDNAFDEQGNWQRGPLRGRVSWLRGKTDGSYDEPQPILADGKPVDVFGMPSPSLDDFDGDGDLDLVCGEFLDQFTYFQNVGTRAKPKFAAGVRLMSAGAPVAMDLQMITPTSIDWDQDGDVDLIVGDEDGRVALVENLGSGPGPIPEFAPPRYFQQEQAQVKFGALVTPVSFDWDDDGDEDLICGNTAGYLGFIENLDGGNPPVWAAPVKLQIEGRPIRFLAGPNGSIQGPCEAKWGYTTLSVADWDHDQLPDIVVNTIWGKVEWLKNVGTRKSPQLAAPQPVRIAWGSQQPAKPKWNWWNPKHDELATQWRTTPLVADLDQDGLQDLIMLDHEGFLAWYQREQRNGTLQLLPPRRVFWGRDRHEYDSAHRSKSDKSGPLRLNNGFAGRSGRRKLCLVDWDSDGDLDLLVNSRSANLLVNEGRDEEGRWWFRDQGQLKDQRLAGHTTSPTTVDWDRNGKPDLLLGAEDGWLYYLPRVD